MKSIISSLIGDREKKILQIVVNHYIKTARPVPSRIIAERYIINLSTATIRNVLAELERAGFLTHPHTSAGRVPTDKGYRFYVDTIKENCGPSRSEQEYILHKYQEKDKEFEHVIRRTSHMLSVISHYASFVVVPEIERGVLKRIELILMENKRVISLLITDTGQVRHKIVQISTVISDEFLHRIEAILNKRFSGLTLGEIKHKLESDDELHFSHDEIDMNIIHDIAKLCREAFTLDDGDSKIYMAGVADFLSCPEFDDFEKMKTVIRVIEEKNLINSLFSMRLEQKGVSVFIGRENPCIEMQECSAVIATYKLGKDSIGTLGIIGPRRMNYSRIIPLVNYVSHILNEVLEEEGNGSKRSRGEDL